MKPIIRGLFVAMALAVFVAGIPAKALGQPPQPRDVPIGTVLDWWRPDATGSVPDGYQICDGSVVNDASSPLNGKTLPDLRGRFVLGVASPADMGTSGGAQSHDHSVNLSHAHAVTGTNIVGPHTHSVDLPPLNESGEVSWAGSHAHLWVKAYLNPNDDKLQVVSIDDWGYENLIGLWSNGIGDEGSGHYPVTIYRETANYYTYDAGSHKHQFSVAHDHLLVNSARGGAHLHKVSVPALNATQTSAAASHLPPYVGLVKIMRIR